LVENIHSTSNHLQLGGVIAAYQFLLKLKLKQKSYANLLKKESIGASMYSHGIYSLQKK